MISRKTLEAELKSLEQPDDNMQPLITHDVLAIYDAITKVADEGGHSGFSFNYMMNLVNTLIIKGRLIRPILDVDDNLDDWNLVEGGGPNEPKLYQNKRRSSVFCSIDADGHKLYTDNDLAAATDDGEIWYHTSRYRMFEVIEVPYLPDGKKWCIYEKTIAGDLPKYAIDKIEKR